MAAALNSDALILLYFNEWNLNPIVFVLSSCLQIYSEFLRSQVPTVRWVVIGCGNASVTATSSCCLSEKKVLKIEAAESVFFFTAELTCWDWFSQVTVYLGKRDFVDHLDHVDPVGELNVRSCWNNRMWVSETFQTRHCFFLLTDGVILVDPEYLKDRKGRTAVVQPLKLEAYEVPLRASLNANFILILATLSQK